MNILNIKKFSKHFCKDNYVIFILLLLDTYMLPSAGKRRGDT